MPRPEELSTLDRLKRTLLAISTALVFLEVSGIEPTGFSLFGLQGEIRRPSALWLMAYSVWVYHLWRYSHRVERTKSTLRSRRDLARRVSIAKIYTALYLASLPAAEREKLMSRFPSDMLAWVEYRHTRLFAWQAVMHAESTYGPAVLKPPVRVSLAALVAREIKVRADGLLRQEYIPEILIPELVFLTTTAGFIARRVWPLLEELARSW